MRRRDRSGWFFDEFVVMPTSCPETTCLAGVDLVRKKVRLLSVMAGSFAATGGRPQPDNVKMDVSSARRLFDGWPTPIGFSGLEIGLAVTFPAESIERDFAYVAHHPLAEAYRSDHRHTIARRGI